jgi:hypothetical protein
MSQGVLDARPLVTREMTIVLRALCQKPGGKDQISEQKILQGFTALEGPLSIMTSSFWSASLHKVVGALLLRVHIREKLLDYQICLTWIMSNGFPG